MKYSKVLYLLIFIILSIATFFSFKQINKKESKPIIINNTKIDKVTIKDKIVISAAGDCTLGSEPNYGYKNSFHHVADNINHDYSYFFKGVRSVFGNDDLTIVNLEGTFTESEPRANKKYCFKGPKSYADILPLGSIEVVNLANNHTYDYLEVGYKDTLKALDDVKVPYFGNELYHIYEIKGIKIGLIGYNFFASKTNKNDVLKGLNYLKEQPVDFIIANFHWGIEYNYKFNRTQQEMAYFAIDNGADLIIGHHPHIIQGLEKYKDKYIVYSLGNFVFGGARYPDDHDTFIFQMELNLVDGKIKSNKINLIPAAVSSIKERNDFQPQILEGLEKTRVLNKILKYSQNFDYLNEKP